MSRTELENNILIQLAKNEEALKFLGEQIRELKDKFNFLHDQMSRQAEEIKDCFYITETNRKSIEDVMEAVDEEIKATKVTVEKFKNTIDSFDERKDKKTLNILQIVVTLGALLIGFFIEFFIKVGR